MPDLVVARWPAGVADSSGQRWARGGRCEEEHSSGMRDRWWFQELAVIAGGALHAFAETAVKTRERGEAGFEGDVPDAVRGFA